MIGALGWVLVSGWCLVVAWLRVCGRGLWGVVCALVSGVGAWGLVLAGLVGVVVLVSVLVLVG